MAKLTIKQVKLSIEKFNMTMKVQLNQLRSHKNNIQRILKLHDRNYDEIRREEVMALRIVKQIKSLVVDIHTLREQVQETDREVFDKSIPIKNEALLEIKAFLDLELKPPDKQRHLVNGDSNLDYIEEFEDLPPIQACFELDEYQLKARTAIMNDVVSLEKEFQDLSGIFKQVSQMVHEQAEPVARVAQNVEETEIAVEQGTSHLRTALKYQKAAYPLMGAIIGTCVAGPLGMLAGMKTGGLLALGGGVLGFTGGKILKKEDAIDGGVAVAEYSSEQTK